MAAVTGWFEEVYAGFTLSLTPDLGMDARGPARADFALALTPDLAMDAAGIGGYFTRSFDLALTPDLGMDAVAMGGASTAEFELAMTPNLGMDSGGSITASFELALSPDLDMAAAGRSVAAFELALTPDLDMSAGGRSLAEVELALTPDLGMDAVGMGGASTAEFELSLTPDLGMSAVGVGGSFTRSFELSLTPDLEMDGFVEFVPTLVSITTAGPFEVPWPYGATMVDIVVHGGGSGAAGGTASLTIVVPAELGTSTTTSSLDEGDNFGPENPYWTDFVLKLASYGEAMPDKVFNGRTYPGAPGGTPAEYDLSQTVGADGERGSGGGGVWSTSLGGGTAGGLCAIWQTATVLKENTDGSPFIGEVGAGGPGTVSDISGGKGGDGAAYFYFYQ